MAYILPEQVGEFIDPRSPEAYLFFPAAVDNDILNPAALNPNDPHLAAMATRNGQIPAEAGTIELSASELAAYDLVSARPEGDRVVIGPSMKSGVDSRSRLVRNDGLLTLSTTSGIVKLVAEVTDPRRAVWNHDYARIGERAFKFLGIDAPVYEIVELQADQTILSPYRRIY